MASRRQADKFRQEVFKFYFLDSAVKNAAFRAVTPIACSGKSWLFVEENYRTDASEASDRSHPRTFQLIYLALSRLLKYFVVDL